MGVIKNVREAIAGRIEDPKHQTLHQAAEVDAGDANHLTVKWSADDLGVAENQQVRRPI